MFGDRPSRSRRMAASCSWPFRRARFCATVSFLDALRGRALKALLDDVGSDWSSEHRRKWVGGPTGGTIHRGDGHGGTSRHLGLSSCREMRWLLLSLAAEKDDGRRMCVNLRAKDF